MPALLTQAVQLRRRDGQQRGQHELIDGRHKRGVMRRSMRSPTRSHDDLHVLLNEQVGAWRDARFWNELHTHGPRGSGGAGHRPIAGEAHCAAAQRRRPAGAAPTGLSSRARGCSHGVMRSAVSSVHTWRLGAGWGVLRDVSMLEPKDIRRAMPRFSADNYAANLKLLSGCQAEGARLNCATATLALAWLLHQGEDIIPIPGRSRPDHLWALIAAPQLALDTATLQRLDALINRHTVSGSRYSAATQAEIDTEEF